MPRTATQSLNRKEVYTTGEVARICHVAPRTVSKWVDTGQLRGYRIPGSRDRRIPAENLLAFMRAHGIPESGLDEDVCRVLIVGSALSNEAAEAMNAMGRYEVRSAANGFEAGLLAQQFHPHAIVLNATVSSEEAAAICRKVKDSTMLQATKVIAVDADLTAHKSRWLIEHGFDDCLPVPCTPARLAQALGR
jgi:excisionase family DNA binding protein